MSKKFLPFISETSSPLNIFKALIQRSKGVSYNKILAIFTQILRDGIDNVREIHDNVASTNTNANTIFNLTAERCLAVREDKQEIVTHCLRILHKKQIRVDELNTENSSVYLVGLYFESLETSWKDYVKNITIYELKEVLENFNLNTLSNIKITADKGEDIQNVGFVTKNEMLAFIAVHESIKRKKPILIKPVALPQGFPMTAGPYTDFGCVSPINISLEA